MESISLTSLPACSTPPPVPGTDADALFDAIAAKNLSFAVNMVGDLEPAALGWSEKHKATPLHYAVRSGDPALVDEILETMRRDAMSLRDSEGKTPLDWAVELGFTNCATLILAAIPKNEPTALQTARAMRTEQLDEHTEEIPSLLEASIMFMNQDLTHEIMERLLASGFNMASPRGCRLLVLAADFGHNRTAQLMLEHFPATEDAECIRALARTLVCASRTGWAEGVHALLDRLPPEALEWEFESINDDWEEELAVHAAVRNGHIDLALAILDRIGLERYRQISQDNDSVLHIAAHAGMFESFQKLLSVLGPEALLVADENKSLALHRAVSTGTFGHVSSDFVAFIADAMLQEDLNIAQRHIKTALEIAGGSRANEDQSIVLELVRRVQPEALVKSPEKQESFVHIATQRRWVKVLQALRECMPTNDFAREAEEALQQMGPHPASMYAGKVRWTSIAMETEDQAIRELLAPPCTAKRAEG